MTTQIENSIEAIEREVEKADRASEQRITNGSLIIAFGHMLDIIREQEERIEHLEDILQGSQERRR